MLFFRAGADVDVYPQIEAARALQFIPDEQRNLARGAAMNQNLGGRNDDDLSDGRVSHRDTSQPFRGVDEQ